MAYEANDGRTLTRGLGRPGKTAVSWAAGGGLLAGGFLVAAMTLTGQLSGHSLLLTCTGLFLVGSLLGFGHGAILGWMGRPEGMDRKAAAKSIAFGAAYAVPALLVTWLLAGWIGMTSVALYSGQTAPIIGCGLAWLVGSVARNFLLGIDPMDTSVYAGVLLTLAGVAALAFFIPARRASRLSPMEALRYE